MKNVRHFTQRYIDWVIKLGRVKFSVLGFLILAAFALLTHIILSFIVVGKIHWESLGYSIIFGLISAPFVIYFFTVLVERLELSRQDLAQLIRDKTDLMATISHELRTPLNGIVGLTRILLDTPLTDEQKNYLNTINVSAVSLGNIFNDVIDLEKIDSRKLELYKKETDFFSFINDINHIAQFLAGQKNLTFELKTSPDLPHFLLIDATRLNQILWNLISNAVKFTEKGKVTLNIQRLSANGFQFSVSDTGQGIPRDELTKIFGMYYQVENKHKAAGSGIGLSISKNIANLMNGNLTVSSELGKGSTFVLTIEAEPLAEFHATSATPVISNLNVLLVEDIELNILVTKSLLEKLGHHVDVAMSGKEAIDKFERHDYDLVLLDIQLPDMSGFEVAHFLRRNYEYGVYDYLPPLVALTANVMQDKSVFQVKGMDDVLRKPLSVTALMECLTQYFDDSTIAAEKSSQDQVKSAVKFEQDFDPAYAEDIDFSHINELTAVIGRAAYRQNLAHYRQARHAELDIRSVYQQFCAQPDAQMKERLCQAAHKLKGAAGSLGLHKVQRLADHIQHGEAADWEAKLSARMAELDTAENRSLQYLQNWIAEVE